MFYTKRQLGVTLIESLVALLVLIAGVVSAVRMQSVILNTHCEAKSAAIEAALINQIISDIRNAANSNCDGTFTRTTEKIEVNAVPTSASKFYCNYSFSISNEQCLTSRTITIQHDILNFKTATAGTANGGNSPLPPSPAIATRVNEGVVANTVGTEQVSAINSATGIRITLDETSNQYRLYRQVTGGWKEEIRSSAPFVRISGVIASTESTMATLLSASGNMAPFLTLNTAFVGYCQFPLFFTNPHDISTYTNNPLPNDARLAAYICFVPEGWEGGIGIDFKEWPNKTHACPDLGAGRPSGLRGGIRSHKTIYSVATPPTSLNQISGQTGVRLSDEPYLRNLDFLIYEANQQADCHTYIRNNGAGRTIVGTGGLGSLTLKSMGYSGIKQFQDTTGTGTELGLEGISCRSKNDCLKPADYWIRIDSTGLLTGTLNRAVGSTFNWNNITLSAQYESTSQACVLDAVVSDSRKFACLVPEAKNITLTVSSSSGTVGIASANPTGPYSPPVTNIVVVLRDGP